MVLSGVITDLQPLPGYFVQGLIIWWWNHKASPWEGFNHPTDGLKLPVFMISIGLEGQSLATPHHFLRQKTELGHVGMTGRIGLMLFEAAHRTPPSTQSHRATALVGLV